MREKQNNQKRPLPQPERDSKIPISHQADLTRELTRRIRCCCWVVVARDEAH